MMRAAGHVALLSILPARVLGTYGEHIAEAGMPCRLTPASPVLPDKNWRLFTYGGN